MNYLGIDIGSSGCKAAVFNSNGIQLALSNREYNAILSEDGGAELDSEEVILKCFEVIHECSRQVESHSIIGIGISSQGEAFTAIGENGEILCNGMISSDTRPVPYVQPWTDQFGKGKLYQITGHTAHPMFTLYKLLWLKENRPEIWTKAKKFLCFEDLLQFRLGLDPRIGYSLAGRTMMFDLRKHEWSDEILNAVGLKKEQFATPLPSGRIAGNMDRKTAQELGLAENAFVVAGGHDQPCGALGAGVTEPGVAMYATGTVECITPAFAAPVFTNELCINNLCIYDHVIDGMYVTVAFSLTGGNILKWFRDEFGYEEVSEAERLGVDSYQLLLQKMGKRPSNLLVLPYFTASGTPYFDTTTRGSIMGLRLSTTREELIRALLEGITFEMRLNMEILENSGCEIHEFRVVGGGAKSDIWTQLKADVTGKNITALNITEAGCTGAAMLACAAHTAEPIRKLAIQWVRPVSTYVPHNEYNKRYNEQFKLYKKVYKTLSEIKL